MGIRLAVIDDNPHLAWDGRTYPVNATFQRFVAALLDVPGPAGGRSSSGSTSACRSGRPSEPPTTLPLDPRIRVVGDGAVRRDRGLPAPRCRRCSARTPAILRPAIRRRPTSSGSRCPASNAPLAATLAVRPGEPRFGYVAGSAADVVAGQRRSGLGRDRRRGRRARLRRARPAGLGRRRSGGRRSPARRRRDRHEPRRAGRDPATRPTGPGRARPATSGSPGPAGSSTARASKPARGARGLAAAPARGAADVELVLGDGPARDASRRRPPGSASRTGSTGSASSPSGRPTSTPSRPPTPSSSRRRPRASRRSSSTRSPSACRSSPRRPAPSRRRSRPAPSPDFRPTPAGIAATIDALVADPDRAHRPPPRRHASSCGPTPARPRPPGSSSAGGAVARPAVGLTPADAPVLTAGAYPYDVLSAIILWAAVGLLAWVYVGYPVVVAILARLAPWRPPTDRPAADAHGRDRRPRRGGRHRRPDRRRVRPGRRRRSGSSRSSIGSDGSTDATERIVAGARGAGARGSGCWRSRAAARRRPRTRCSRPRAATSSC